MIKLLPFIFVILWSSAFITTKPITDHSDPFAALAFRFLIVALGFFIFSIYKKHKIIIKKKFLLESLSTGILLKGVGKSYFEERKIFKHKIIANHLEGFKNNKGIFIGEKLRDRLNVKIGDSINIISPNSYETIFGNLPRSNSFKVIGFFSIGMYEYDSSLVFMPLELMQNFLNLDNQISKKSI